MHCPNCHEFVEEGATYCGNCGQPLKSGAAALGSTSLKGQAPKYAVALPLQHAGETQAVISVLCGISGLAGTLFVPIVGLSLGTAGLVIGTVARVYSKRNLRFAGLLLSSLAILASLAAWADAMHSDPRYNTDISRTKAESSQAQVTNSLSTPCYSLNFVNELNVLNEADSCDMNAFNGKTLSASTNFYKVYAVESDVDDIEGFNELAETAIEKDFSESIPDFKADAGKTTTFAGSPAYVVTAKEPNSKSSIVEAIVMHKVPNGKNVFVIVHANVGNSADLQLLESQWQWK